MEASFRAASASVAFGIACERENGAIHGVNCASAVTETLRRAARGCVTEVGAGDAEFHGVLGFASRFRQML